MKRFYKVVSTRADATGAAVLLDGRLLRTPERRPLLVPNATLAGALAAEWAGQGPEVRPALMPLTRLATTAVDLMPARRGDAAAEASGYAATDLLCYRAPAPAALARRQDALWQPWLDWAAREHDARLAVTRGIGPVPQPEPSLRALRAAVEAHDDWRLVGLHAGVTATGSVVLGLALAAGALDAGGAFEAALLDELFEVERWGLEEEQAKRHAALRLELEAAERYLRALRIPSRADGGPGWRG